MYGIHLTPGLAEVSASGGGRPLCVSLTASRCGVSGSPLEHLVGRPTVQAAPAVPTVSVVGLDVGGQVLLLRHRFGPGGGRPVTLRRSSRSVAVEAFDEPVRLLAGIEDCTHPGIENGTVRVGAGESLE